mmetsp:Transcript_29064/g.5260  ORF Transcript_29064/g.5260 Transcript_29064/m.5260 type:complete len:134 (+) Transcript_29064:1000-1401(+)
MCANGREPTVEQGKTVCKSFHDRKVEQRLKDAKRLNSGLVFSEFGACKNTPGCVEEIRGATGAFDKGFVSWMYWQYKWMKDFTTTSDDLEGLFYVNGTVQELKHKALKRTYAPLIQGTPVSNLFDPVTYDYEL